MGSVNYEVDVVTDGRAAEAFSTLRSSWNLRRVAGRRMRGGRLRFMTEGEPTVFRQLTGDLARAALVGDVTGTVSRVTTMGYQPLARIRDGVTEIVVGNGQWRPVIPATKSSPDKVGCHLVHTDSVIDGTWAASVAAFGAAKDLVDGRTTLADASGEWGDDAWLVEWVGVWVADVVDELPIVNAGTPLTTVAALLERDDLDDRRLEGCVRRIVGKVRSDATVRTSELLRRTAKHPAMTSKVAGAGASVLVDGGPGGGRILAPLGVLVAEMDGPDIAALPLWAAATAPHSLFAGDEEAAATFQALAETADCSTVELRDAVAAIHRHSA